MFNQYGQEETTTWSNYRNRRQGVCGNRNQNGNSNSSNNPNKLSSKNTTLTGYNYHIGISKKASDFESATKYLINLIMKLYNYSSNIEQALEDLTPVS